MINNILITGGSGFIAKHLCKRLSLDKKLNLYVLHRKKKQKVLYNKNYNNLYCDITDIFSLKKSLKNIKINFIYHLASESLVEKSISKPIETFRINIITTLNILEIAKEKNVNGLFISSSIEVYSKKNKLPINESDLLYSETPYGISKIFTENLARYYNLKFNIPVIISRSGIIFGGEDNNQSRLVPYIIKSIIYNKKIVIKSPKNTVVDLLYVKDFVNFLTNLISYFNLNKINYEVLNISSGKPKYIVDVVNKLISISSYYKYKPVYGNNKSINRYMSNKKIEKSFGWKKESNFEKSLLDTLNSYKKSKK